MRSVRQASMDCHILQPCRSAMMCKKAPVPGSGALDRERAGRERPAVLAGSHLTLSCQERVVPKSIELAAGDPENTKLAWSLVEHAKLVNLDAAERVKDTRLAIDDC